jgi:hypothetical protein
VVKVSFFCNSPLSLFSCISLDATKSDVECKVETGVEVKVQFGAVTEVEGEAITKVEAEVGTEAAASAKAELAAKLKSAVAGRVRTYVGRGFCPGFRRPRACVPLVLWAWDFFVYVFLPRSPCACSSLFFELRSATVQRHTNVSLAPRRGGGRQHRRILIGQVVGNGAVAPRLHTREIHPGGPHRGSSTVVFRGLLPRLLGRRAACQRQPRGWATTSVCLY